MKILRMMLAEFLRGSQIKVEITGFDLDGFDKALQRELRRRLDMIEYLIFEDEDVISDGDKVAEIKRLFEQEFILKE